MSFINVYPAFVLVIASLFFAWDIVADILDGHDTSLHLLIEAAVFVAITVALYQEFKRLGRIKYELAEEKGRTARLTGELLAVIRGQFSEWGLSRSESEVALLLIKGLSMKEIAEARTVKEKTVRQQATSIYAKCGYAGRHELAAHFIEDLMAAEPAADRPH